MKRMLVGAVAGLLCFGAAQISAASPTLDGDDRCDT